MDVLALGQRPVIRRVLMVLAGVVLLNLVAWGVLVALQATQGDVVLAGVEVAGEPMDGLSRGELEEQVEDRASERLEQPVSVRSAERTLEVDRRAAGEQANVDAAVDEAWSHGRRGLWRALYDHVAARMGSTLEVDLESTVADDRLRTWAEAAAEHLSVAPQQAAVAFDVVEAPDDVEILVVEPRTGVDVGAEEIEEPMAEALETSGPIDLEVDGRTSQPDATQEDLDQILPVAELAVSAPVTLENPGGGDDLTLSPAQLAGVLTVDHRPEEGEGDRLELVGDGDRLLDVIGDDLERLEVAATDASFHVTNGTVEIEGGQQGFELDASAAAERTVELAQEEPSREGQLPGDVTEPNFTREEAEELGLEEEVSSFTTPLTPGESRNQNIHRGADLLEGTLIEPGERFSLNEAIGPRTEARGFVENGYIDAEGDLVNVVGGGSSQLGTTFMNAAWFAGIELLDFQPHSYYFERYPMGREATLSYNTIDVVVVNDSPYGLLISTSYSESAVTISLYSSQWANVDSWTGDPYNRVSGDERDGFDVDFGRTITYPDGSSESESYTHRYEPED